VTQPVVGPVGPYRSTVEQVGRRRRAWLRAACVFLAAGVYLNIWTTYALHGLTEYGRYVQHEPGASAVAMGAEFRLVSLVQTTEVTNSITDEIELPPANAVWLVARLEVVRHTEEEDLFCSFQVLGPQRRIWKPSSNYISRTESSSCDVETMELGRGYPLEVIFEIPQRYVGDLAGVVVNDPVSRGARPVLMPPG
jgi:hypothetical protein